MLKIKEQRKNDSNKRIIDAAIVVFSKYGYQNAKIEEIAELSKVTKGLIVQRFGSKEALYLELLIKSFSIIFDKAKVFPDLETALISMIKAIKVDVSTKHYLYGFLYQYYVHEDEVSSHSKECIEKLFNESSIADLIINAIKDKVIKDIKPYVLFNFFVKTTLLNITNASEVGIPLLDDEEYLKPLYINNTKISTASKRDENDDGLSLDMLEKILKKLPSNVFYKDINCRYVFCSQIWKQVKTDGSPNWSIRGKSDLEIRYDTENAIKAYEEDKKILKTGISSSYIISSTIDGVTDYLELIKEPVRDHNGHIIGIVGQINNVTDKVKMENELKHLAETDELTGIGNRQSLYKWVDNSYANAKYPLAILMADCDYLKIVNDQLGHILGDRYIQSVVSTLKASIPEEAMIYRYGGDEFVIIIPNTSKKHVEEITNIFHKQNVYVKNVRVTCSIGYSIIKDNTTSFDEALRHADTEMYKIKR